MPSVSHGLLAKVAGERLALSPRLAVDLGDVHLEGVGVSRRQVVSEGGLARGLGLAVSAEVALVDAPVSPVRCHVTRR